MTIATKNGSVIINGGSVAEGCGCCGDDPCYPEAAHGASSVSLTISAYNSSLCNRRSHTFSNWVATDNFVFDGATTYSGTHILDFVSETQHEYIVASPTLQNLSASCVNQGKIYGLIYKSRRQAQFFGTKLLTGTPGFTPSQEQQGQLIARFYIPITSAMFFNPPTRTNQYNDFVSWLAAFPQCRRDAIVPFVASGQTFFGQWSEDRVEDGFSARTYLWICDLCCVVSPFDGKTKVLAVGGEVGANSGFYTFPSSPGRVIQPGLNVNAQMLSAVYMWNFAGISVAPQVTAVSLL